MEFVRYYSTAGYPEDVPLREVPLSDVAWSQFGAASESTNDQAKHVTATFFNRSHSRARTAQIEVFYSQRKPKP